MLQLNTELCVMLKLANPAVLALALSTNSMSFQDFLSGIVAVSVTALLPLIAEVSLTALLSRIAGVYLTALPPGIAAVSLAALGLTLL